MTPSPTHRPTRRSFLRGAGAALALPWFASLAGPRHRAAPPPPRVVWLYAPNGVHPDSWFPDQGDAEALRPLTELSGTWTMLRGLGQDQARAHGDGPGDHARAAAVFLTGVHPVKADGKVQVGISADQIAARALEGRTPLRSVQFGLEPSGLAGQCDSGYACAYSSHVSWEGPTRPAHKEVDPRRAFDRCFRASGRVPSPAELRRHRSLLDFVREDARALHGRLSTEDRSKLEEYLEAVRDLERRLDSLEESVVDRVDDSERPAGVPSDPRAHAEVMLRILALALQNDVTRVFTFMFGNEGSNRTYRGLGLREGHHSLTHHAGDEEKIRAVVEIDRHFSDLAAGFLRTLATLEAEDGTPLLDHCLVVYGSGIRDGNRHDHHDLPIVLAGGKALGLRHENGERRFPDRSPLNSLHLALLAMVGVDAEPFGDADGPLEL